jgi:sugar lactone lactonase YvrE
MILRFEPKLFFLHLQKRFTMKYIFTLLSIFFIPAFVMAQDELFYPVDIVYHEAGECYYVSNWADGEGYILKLDLQGQIIETFYTGLHFSGGICMVGDILYVGDNLQIWSSSDHKSYLIGIDVNTGNQVLNFEISTGGTYLDLMDADWSGNIYIGNSRNGGNDGIVHKFNIATQQLTNLVTGITKPFGVCYDPYSNRVLYTNSSATISYIRSVSPDGGAVTNVYYTEGYLEGIVMHPNADFYLSSWGTADGAWGNEPVYKTNHEMNWDYQLEEPHNRPFGMCIGYDNHLVVCNWGDHTLSFIDLDLYGVDEINTNENSFTIYPNPARGHVYLKFNNPETQEIEVTIHDIMGNEVHREKINRKDILSEKEINLQSLPAGTYILNVFDGIKVSHEKLVIF